MTNGNVTRTSSPYDFAWDGCTVSGLPLPDANKGDAAEFAGLIGVYNDIFSGIFNDICVESSYDDINASLADYLLRVSEWRSMGDMTEECDDRERALLASALGLRCIDDFVRQMRSGELGLALVLSWDKICDAHMEAADAFRCGRLGGEAAIERSRLARQAALASHAARPIAAAKAFVRDCWSEWQKQPSQYKTSAAFSRAMVDKRPDEITSTVTVERWVRQWRLSDDE